MSTKNYKLQMMRYYFLETLYLMKDKCRTLNRILEPQ